MEKKKKSIVGRILGILGILLVAAIAFCVIYVFTAGQKVDRSGALFGDPTATDFVPETTGTAAHLSFSKDADMSLILDEGDLVYFFTRAAGENWTGKLDRFLPFGLKLTGIGLDVKPEGISVLAELCRGKLVIPVEALCRADYENGEIRLAPERISVLGITRDAEFLLARLGYSPEDLSWSCKPKTLFMKEIETLELQDGFVMLTGKLATDYLVDSSVDEGRSVVMRFSQKTSCYAGAVLNESTVDDPTVCFAPILDRLQNDPAFFTTYLSQLFRVISPGTGKVTDMNYGLIYRWFPEIKDSYSDERTEENASFQMHVHSLSSLTDYVLTRYHGKKLMIRDGEFLLNKDSFTAESFYTDNYGTYRNLYTDIDNSRFCLCLLQEDGHKGNPKLSEICDSPESISGETDKSLRYAIGILLRGADGTGFVLVFPDDGCQITPLDEDVFLELMSSPGVPLYDETA